ncbi:MAG: hypothetical protein ACJAS7_001141 [Alpinimonas sp.]
MDAGAIASGDLRQVMRVALREHPDVIVIDGIDTVAAPEARAGVRDALSLAATDKRRRGRPLTIVVGTTTKAPAEALGDVLPNVEEAAVFKLTTPKKPASKKPASKKSAQTKSAQTKAKVTA